jgi:hypothetical protein
MGQGPAAAAKDAGEQYLIGQLLGLLAVATH